jgi:hypothetical protein
MELGKNSMWTVCGRSRILIVQIPYYYSRQGTSRHDDSLVYTLDMIP